MGIFENLDEQRALTAANPSGENGYDNGQQFNEGGVARDYTGRFSSGGGGTSRSTRESRRNASIFRRRKDRKEKEAKKTGSPENKAKKAKEDAERQKLASLSLAIAQASAGGETIRAAELRVQRAELAVSFADTPTERTNAQTTLVNAKAALARARRSAVKRTTAKQPTRITSIEQFHDVNGRYPSVSEIKSMGL